MRGTTIDMRIYAGNYAECWKVEMLHAYDLLIDRSHPIIDYPREYVIASREAFLEYVENNALMYAYVENSDAFHSEPDGRYSEEIHSGTILPVTISLSRAYSYMEQTFYLYEILRTEPDFIFDAGSLTEIRSGTLNNPDE